jgi:hypothetical protein
MHSMPVPRRRRSLRRACRACGTRTVEAARNPNHSNILGAGQKHRATSSCAAPDPFLPLARPTLNI